MISMIFLMLHYNLIIISQCTSSSLSIKFFFENEKLIEFFCFRSKFFVFEARKVLFNAKYASARGLGLVLKTVFGISLAFPVCFKSVK
jgi:hypothetical protein